MHQLYVIDVVSLLLGITMNSSEPDTSDDDAWIEAEIQRQLDALTPHEDEEEEEEKDYQVGLVNQTHSVGFGKGISR